MVRSYSITKGNMSTIKFNIGPDRSIKINPEDEEANMLLQHLGLKGSPFQYRLNKMEINIELYHTKKYPRGGVVNFDLNPLVSQFNSAMMSPDYNFADILFHTSPTFCNASSQELQEVCSNPNNLDIVRPIDFKIFNYLRNFEWYQDKYTVCLFKDSIAEVPNYAYIIVNDEVGAYEDHFYTHDFTEFAELLDSCRGYIIKFKLDNDTSIGMIPRIRYKLDKFVQYDFVRPYGSNLSEKISCFSKSCVEIDGVSLFDDNSQTEFKISVEEVGLNLTMRPQNIVDAFVSNGF